MPCEISTARPPSQPLTFVPPYTAPAVVSAAIVTPVLTPAVVTVAIVTTPVLTPAVVTSAALASHGMYSINQLLEISRILVLPAQALPLPTRPPRPNIPADGGNAQHVVVAQPGVATGVPLPGQAQPLPAAAVPQPAHVTFSPAVQPGAWGPGSVPSSHPGVAGLPRREPTPAVRPAEAAVVSVTAPRSSAGAPVALDAGNHAASRAPTVSAHVPALTTTAAARSDGPASGRPPLAYSAPSGGPVAGAVPTFMVNTMLATAGPPKPDPTQVHGFDSDGDSDFDLDSIQEDRTGVHGGVTSTPVRGPAPPVVPAAPTVVPAAASAREAAPSPRRLPVTDEVTAISDDEDFTLSESEDVEGPAQGSFVDEQPRATPAMSAHAEAGSSTTGLMARPKTAHARSDTDDFDRGLMGRPKTAHARSDTDDFDRVCAV